MAANLDVTTVGSSAFKMGTQLLFAVIAIIVIVALYFITKYSFSAYKNWKNYKITAIIMNRDGTWYTKKIGKFRTKDNIDKMLFRGSKDTMPVIDPAYIRSYSAKCLGKIISRTIWY